MAEVPHITVHAIVMGFSNRNRNIVCFSEKSIASSRERIFHWRQGTITDNCGAKAFTSIETNLVVTFMVAELTASALPAISTSS